MAQICTKLIIIRHAEKPDPQANIGGVSEAGGADRNDLTVRGWQRAGALVRLFNPHPPRVPAAGVGGSRRDLCGAADG